jgi:tRNA-Thr(GGU) m(6)t(6)A37 methyltransferase TsaA
VIFSGFVVSATNFLTCLVLHYGEIYVIEEGKLKFIGIVEDADELSKVKIFPEFCEGLQHLNNFSHVIILYWFHLRDNEKERSVLKVIPRRHPGAPEVGVFASRSPSRPNLIGFCVAKLVKMEECTLTVKGLDALQNSPIIDIKPYIPRADCILKARVPEWTSGGPPT